VEDSNGEGQLGDGSEEEEEGADGEEGEGGSLEAAPQVPDCESLRAVRGTLTDTVAGVERWLAEEVDQSEADVGPSRFRERVIRLTQARDAFLAAFQEPEDTYAEEEVYEIVDGNKEGPLGVDGNRQGGPGGEEVLRQQLAKLQQRVEQLEDALQACNCSLPAAREGKPYETAQS